MLLLMQCSYSCTKKTKQQSIEVHTCIDNLGPKLCATDLNTLKCPHCSYYTLWVCLSQAKKKRSTNYITFTFSQYVSWAKPLISFQSFCNKVLIKIKKLKSGICRRTEKPSRFSTTQTFWRTYHWTWCHQAHLDSQSHYICPNESLPILSCN